MEALKINARVTNGRLSTYSTKLIREYIELLEGKIIEIHLSKAKSKRSDLQNRYYWGCVVPIITEELKRLGHRLNHEEVHYYLKSKFNSKPLCDANGELIGEIAQSTAELNKSEFIEYIDKIVQWSAEVLEIIIPEPEKQIELV